MICNVCGKNIATIHVTEMIDGKMSELHVCEQCAKEKEMSSKLNFSINDLMNGLMKFTSEAQDVEEQLRTKCPGCNHTIKDLQKKGRVGCAQCYEAFSKFLLPLIGKVQSATQHCGKKPAASILAHDVQDELYRLEGQLKRQIETEAFEDAAATRDAIKAIKDSLDQPAKKKAKPAPKTRKAPKKSGE